MTVVSMSSSMSSSLTSREQVFLVWCRLTGTDAEVFGPDEREAFYARPQVPVLATAPYEVLLDAGINAARRGSLPLERWVHAVQVVRVTCSWRPR